MTMAPLPQVARDLTELMDPAIMYASRAGEHMAVMLSSAEKHQIKKNFGDVWKGVHVAKIEAVTGGPRTRFTNTARASAEKYECQLGYTVSLYAMADDQKTFLNREYLRQWGAQQGEAIARSVDRVLLGIFRTFTDITGTTNTKVHLEQYLDAKFKLDAAEDDSSSPVQIVVPVAHLRDLTKERITANTGNAILRPLTPDASSKISGKPKYQVLDSMVRDARNSPKYGTDGYSGVFRKTAVKVVTAPVMKRATERDERTGGGATTIIMRKLWGFVVPPHALRNYASAIRGQMNIGGR